MIYARYHAQWATKIAAERARVDREDAEIAGSSATPSTSPRNQTQPPAASVAAVATKPPQQNHSAHQQQQRRR